LKAQSKQKPQFCYNKYKVVYTFDEFYSLTLYFPLLLSKSNGTTTAFETASTLVLCCSIYKFVLRCAMEKEDIVEEIIDIGMKHGKFTNKKGG
jgi:hypothetical protein